ncbi:MAG: BACON domain-containing protein [Bacteroidales bacterium]|nr:BACON domain-containing protein [Bacteroidales bacterium]
MKLRNLLIGALAAVGFMTACEMEENLGTPKIALSESELAFDKDGGSRTITVVATRDWAVEENADWLAVSPNEGTASSVVQDVVLTVLPNDGMDREVEVKFTIGMTSKYLKVVQAGPGGSAEQLIVFFNDFDKEEATKSYGSSGGSWPYLDLFDGWMNQTGTGAASVTYNYSGMSARANSTSDSNYSDYAGSGMNNMFFGKSAYLATKGIALGDATSFELTFGTEKYSQDNGSVFTNSEFHVYLSNDGEKWVELKDYTFAGGTTEGRWNVASANFSVPAGTETLSVCMAVDVASSYRMDDLKLVISDKQGTAVDFSAAKEMDFTAGGSSSGEPVTPPSNITDVTVAEFNEKPVSTSDWYRLSGTVGGPVNMTYGNFDLIDETGKVYVYGISNWSEYSSIFAEGGTVTVVGQRGDYNGKIEVLEAYIESFTPGSGDPGNDPGNDESGKPASLTKATVEEFLAAEVSSDVWYELTGEITSIVSGNAYGNLYINDGTGEVYIYGLTNGWVGYNDKSFDSIGLKVGDTVTIGTLRGEYNGSPQGGGSAVPAYYISHVPGEGGNDENGDVSDATWAYTFAEGDLGTTGNLSSSVTLNGIEWSFVMNDADYLGWDSSNGRGLQMGKKADPASSITLSTSGISGTVKKIVINTSGASGTDATLVVKVGGENFGSSIQTTNSAADYTFEGSASGAIELNWTLTAAAVYIKSIAVYTE